MSPDAIDTTHGATRPAGNISRWSIEHPYIVAAFYLGVAILSLLVIGFQMLKPQLPRRTGD